MERERESHKTLGPVCIGPFGKIRGERESLKLCFLLPINFQEKKKSNEEMGKQVGLVCANNNKVH